MNIKTISIALTVLVFALLATTLMQKGNYVSQATEHYEKTTMTSYKGTSKMLEYLSTSLETHRTLWAMVCDAKQNAKTAKQMADLESKYFPTIKGSTSLANKTRHFEVSSFYYITTYFDKVEVDKKTDVKTLTNMLGFDIRALTGQAEIKQAGAEAEAAEESEGDAE